MIVADAIPLIHLARANRLQLLPRLYDRVAVPPSVWQEVSGTSEKRAEAHVLEDALEKWLEIRDLPRKAVRVSASLRNATPLGRGEADAIALAEAMGVGIVMDDAIAVGLARMRGLRTRWTTSVVLEAHAREVLSAREARAAIRDLVRAGLWLRQDVLLSLLEILGGRSD
jgi:predicted nucleic acid-binding protein